MCALSVQPCHPCNATTTAAGPRSCMQGTCLLGACLVAIFEIECLSSLQVILRQSVATRCNPTSGSAQRCHSNQDASCSGRSWLSGFDASNASISKGGVSCSASAAESDLHLPGIASGAGGGAGNGSGLGGNSGGGDGYSEGGDGEEYLGIVEVKPDVSCIRNNDSVACSADIAKFNGCCVCRQKQLQLEAASLCQRSF